MNLYTEAQLHKLIIRYRQNLTEFSFNKPTVEQLIEELTPIQIPTDEEIHKRATDYSNLYYEFRAGADWVIDNIKNQI